MNDVWYYQYEILYWDDDNSKEEVLSGITLAASFVEATEKLEEYYGTGIMEIRMLKTVCEGNVFEFEMMSDDSSFDFEINRKN